jgi:VanZ family protein
MFNEPPREREWISWLNVAVWTVVIYLTIPFARALQEDIAGRWGREFFTYFVVGSLVFVVVAAMLGILRASRHAHVSGYFWLGGVAALTIYSAGNMSVSPEEAIHFLQYGLLGVLLFRALSHRLRDVGIYLVVLLIGALIGTFDEIIQWIVPERFFAFADIRLNAYAVLLSIVAIAKGIKPPFISRRIEPASVRWICPLAAAQILLLAACASNTQRVFEAYTRLPALAFLRETAGVMAEYGYRYRDPDFGTFYSRLPIGELRRQDEQRSAEAAAALDSYALPKKYEAFLRKYTATGDPFLHEARVHLFRRDHYRSVMWKHKGREEKYRYHATVAFRENQIMEKYFSNTLHRSSYTWSSEDLAALEKEIDPTPDYESEVSAYVLTGFTLRQLWAATLLALVVLAVVRRYYGEQKA